MKKVIVNRIKLVCSKGRIEKGETVILPDDEVARITAGRPDIITVLESIEEAPLKPASKPKTKPKTRKPANAKVTKLN